MGRRILLIEDDADIADFVMRGLREHGHFVERSAHGDLALEVLRQSAWDLVVLDWRLPGQDGIQIIRRFREFNSETPVLFLTARDGIADRVQGLDAGANDYLCKPFAFAEFLARVRALTRRRRPAKDAVLVQGDISLNLETQRAQRAGRPLSLTSKELALLTFLLRHPGEVLTKKSIYERVWDEPYDESSNTLEVHVTELRRKLEAHGPRVIHTLRRRGYVFGTPPEKTP